MSALNNDRFRVMLEQIGNPQSSGDLVTMGGNSDSTVVDFKTHDASQSSTLLHRRQLAHYMTAVSRASGAAVSGLLLYL